MDDKSYSTQRVAVTLRLDREARAMLRELAPTTKSHGRYLSELIRRDYIRKEEFERRQVDGQRVEVTP